MGETLNPVSCSLILRYLSFGSYFPIQGKGFGNQGTKKTRLHRYKAGFDCSLIAVDFLAASYSSSSAKR